MTWANLSQRLLSFVRRVTPLRIALVVGLVFAGTHFVIESEFFEFGPFSKKGLIHLLDLKALDIKFQYREFEELPEPRVVVAAIDEASVERYGLWPWSRRIIAEFINQATAAGAKVIAFDAVFSDEDKNSSYRSIKRFVSDFETRGLHPEARQNKKLLASMAQVGKAQERVAGVLDVLEKKSGKRGGGKAGGPVAGSVKRARAALAQSREELAKTRAGLASWAQRSTDFYDAMNREIAIVSPDQALAKAIRNSPQTILGYFTFLHQDELTGISSGEAVRDVQAVQPSAIGTIYDVVVQPMGDTEIEMLRPAEDVKVSEMQIRPIAGVQAPLEVFAKEAQGFGYFNIWPDVDGPMRRAWMFTKFGEQLFPSLSLLSIARYLDESEIRPLNGLIRPGLTISGVSLGPDMDIPTDLHGRLLINYYTDPQKYFPTYSVADFVEREIDPAVVKDKIILFGATALGTYDFRPTPFSPATPGVYIHASAIQSILDGRYLERPYGLALLEMVGYLLLAVLMGLALPKIPAWGGILATLGFAALLYLVDMYLVFAEGVWMLNVLPTIQALTTYIGISVHGYLTEGREKRQIRKAFQFYLTKSVVDEVLKDTSKLQLGGEKRVCTVLFSDIRGFTSISERLSPEELVQLLNDYLTPMTNLVFKYDGTLDKYMGDAIMAIFGAPVAYPNHAARGCWAALEMMEELHVLQEGWRADGLPELDIGIGLNTGHMSVGNMGSEVRFDYTVMGDNVNLGSRLEGINKQYGTNIIISEYTYAAAKEDIYAREIDSVRVKGKKEPVVIYELLGRGKASSDQAAMIETFEAGIASYKAQRWDEAIATFERVRNDLKVNDFTSGLYIDRCNAMREKPPGDDWDGVFVMTTK